MDLIQSLQIFQRIAETGSFVRTATMLGMAPSSISATIQKLEARLGAQLFQRSTRRVTLSSDGEILYERASRLLADARDTEALFRSDSLPSGRLRVEVPARIARLLVAPGLPSFLERYPDIDIELGSTDRVSDLLQEGIDCVLRVGQVGDVNLVARALGELPQSTFASPAFLARHGVPQTLEQLALCPVVHYGHIPPGKTETWEYQTGNGLKTLAMRGRVSVSNAEAYIACCLAGLGMIQVPRYDIDDLLASGELVEVLPQYAPPALPMTVLYPYQQQLSRRLRVFLDWLENLVAGHAQ